MFFEPGLHPVENNEASHVILNLRLQARLRASLGLFNKLISLPN
jgi:hypothetical protein